MKLFKSILVILLVFFYSNTYAEVGYIVDVGASLPAVSSITQTSRVWYVDGLWWCIGDDGSGDDWFIYKKTGVGSTPGAEEGWTKTANNVDTRGSSVIDAYLEAGAGATSDGLLHIVAMHSSLPYYSQWDYNAAADTYAVNTSVGASGFLDISDAGEIGAIVDNNFTLCIVADGSGEVFIAYYDQTGDDVEIAYTTDPENNSFVAYEVDTAVEVDSGAQKLSMIPFDDGTASIGILYMDADEDVGFAYHADSAASNSWTTEVAYAETVADDHVNLTADDSGNLFGVTKNGDATSKLRFHKKASGGSWATTTVFSDGNQTRPQCVTEITNDEVYVFYRNTTTDNIDYIKSAIGTIAFGGATALIDADQILNETSLPKQTTDATSDLVATCWNGTNAETWWNELPISATSSRRTFIVN